MLQNIYIYTHTIYILEREAKRQNYHLPAHQEMTKRARGQKPEAGNPMQAFHMKVSKSFLLQPGYWYKAGMKCQSEDTNPGTHIGFKYSYQWLNSWTKWLNGLTIFKSLSSFKIHFTSILF